MVVDVTVLGRVCWWRVTFAVVKDLTRLGQVCVDLFLSLPRGEGLFGSFEFDLQSRL